MCVCVFNLLMFNQVFQDSLSESSNLRLTLQNSIQMDLSGSDPDGGAVNMSAIKPCVSGYLAASGSNFRLSFCRKSEGKLMPWVTARRHFAQWLAVYTGTSCKASHCNLLSSEHKPKNWPKVGAVYLSHTCTTMRLLSLAWVRQTAGAYC